jgi:cytochrome c oxidase cbb3-type subunit 3
MPSKPEKDSVTGVETTGHEWDGIRELNNPLPSWWVWTFYVCIAFSVLWFILFPAIPFGPSATTGLTGNTARERVAREIAEAESARAGINQRIVESDVQQIRADPDLFTYAVTGGEILYGDNCAPCHGVGGSGQLNYPVLADDAWIWGGTLDQIQQTILYGVRNQEYEFDARFSMMPSFGSDQLLSAEEIDQVANYVVTLSGREPADAELAAAGAQLYAEQCASCHGQDGAGMAALGAPNLTDAIWLYGGDVAEIRQQIWQPRHGVMPGWVDRLAPEEIKMVSLYVHSLGGGQ